VQFVSKINNKNYTTMISNTDIYHKVL